MLADDGDGECTMDEFIAGILRCKGPARAIDQVAMQHDIWKLHDKVDKALGMMQPADGTGSQTSTRSDPVRQKKEKLHHVSAAWHDFTDDHIPI